MHLPWTTRRIVETQYSVLGNCRNLFIPQYRAFNCLWWVPYTRYSTEGGRASEKLATFYSLADAQSYLDSLCPPPKPARVPATPIPKVIHPYPPLTPEQRRAKLIAGLTPVSNPLCDTRSELGDALKRATDAIDDRSET